VQNLYILPENLQSVANTPFYTLGNGTGQNPYTISQNLTQAGVANGLGSYRPAVQLTAFVGGLMVSYNQNTTTGIAPYYALLGTGTIQLDPTHSRLQASFAVANASSSVDVSPDVLAGAYYPES
jgi:hypothetical protein